MHKFAELRAVVVLVAHRLSTHFLTEKLWVQIMLGAGLSLSSFSPLSNVSLSKSVMEM